MASTTYIDTQNPGHIIAVRIYGPRRDRVRESSLRQRSLDGHGFEDSESDDDRDIHADFQIYPWGTNDSSDGPRIVIHDPWSLQNLTQFTWISDGENVYKTTRGNIIVAQIPVDRDWKDNRGYPGKPSDRDHRPWSETFNFTSEYDPAGDQRKYKDASVIQAFYTLNMYHGAFTSC